MNSKVLLRYLAFALLVIAYIISLMAGDGNVEARLQEILPEVDRFEKIGSKPLAYAAYIENGNNKSLVGYVALGSANGYGGPVKMLVAIDPEGNIVDVQALIHKETPSFFFKVMRQGFYDQFIGKPVNNSFHLEEDIDAVTGATLTSRGITNAVRQAAYGVGRQQLGMNIPVKQKTLPFGYRELAVISLFFVGTASAITANKRLRWMSMIASVVILGFWLNAAISLANIVTLVKGYMPSPYENLLWNILILGALVIVLALGKNVYCYWLCPFGTLQELMAKVGGKQVKCRQIVWKPLKNLKYILTWAALMIALLLNNPGLGSYEPFATIFGLQGIGIQWFLPPVVLLASMFIFRFWCNYFCPVGVVMELLVRIRRWLGRKIFPGGVIWTKKTLTRRI